jgi:hypothetical protein
MKYEITEVSGTANDARLTDEIFRSKRLMVGRMISQTKSAPDGHKCVWNANIITKKSGKVWFGDLDLTKEGHLLTEIAEQIGEPLYVLRESDCRFGSENKPAEDLIKVAVWSTND